VTFLTVLVTLTVTLEPVGARGEEEYRSTNDDVDEKIETVIEDDFMH
jgi:hypothetical protein